jgi:hypothetical protein
MLAIYVSKSLRVKSEMGLVVLDAKIDHASPHRDGDVSVHRSRGRCLFRILAFQLWTCCRFGLF